MLDYMNYALGIGADILESSIITTFSTWSGAPTRRTFETGRHETRLRRVPCSKQSKRRIQSSADIHRKRPLALAEPETILYCVRGSDCADARCGPKTAREGGVFASGGCRIGAEWVVRYEESWNGDCRGRATQGWEGRGDSGDSSMMDNVYNLFNIGVSRRPNFWLWLNNILVRPYRSFGIVIRT